MPESPPEDQVDRDDTEAEKVRRLLQVGELFDDQQAEMCSDAFLFLAPSADGDAVIPWNARSAFEADSALDRLLVQTLARVRAENRQLLLDED